MIKCLLMFGYFTFCNAVLKRHLVTGRATKSTHIPGDSKHAITTGTNTKKQSLKVNSTVKTSACIMPLEVMHAILKQVESRNFLKICCKILCEGTKCCFSKEGCNLYTYKCDTTYVEEYNDILSLQNCIDLLGTIYTSFSSVSQYLGNFVIKYHP